MPPPDERPVAFHDVPEDWFPIAVDFFDITDPLRNVVHTIEAAGPGAMRIPGFEELGIAQGHVGTDVIESALNGGLSTCPICGRHWRVTPLDDCMLPACGEFGSDASQANPDRPCEGCGLRHQESHG